jgi:hypothetical protein
MADGCLVKNLSYPAKVVQYHTNFLNRLLSTQLARMKGYNCTCLRGPFQSSSCLPALFLLAKTRRRLTAGCRGIRSVVVINRIVRRRHQERPRPRPRSPGPSHYLSISILSTHIHPYLIHIYSISTISTLKAQLKKMVNLPLKRRNSFSRHTLRGDLPSTNASAATLQP